MADSSLLLGSYVDCRKKFAGVRMSRSHVKVSVIFRRVQGHWIRL